MRNETSALGVQKILILWLGAFWFAIAKHLWENNPEYTIYASEINKEIYDAIEKTRSHPYFFDGAKLPDNIELISETTTLLSKIDIVISVIPCQFIWWAFSGMKDNLKKWVTILNLSKWIDNKTLEVSSEKIASVLNPPVSDSFDIPLNKGETWSGVKGGGFDYTYAYLAGGMIAAELVGWKMLWADIACTDEDAGKMLMSLFQSESLDIHMIIWNTKNTELYAALKNIIALILGYYEWLWQWASSRWYYLMKLLEEISYLIAELWGSSDLEFGDYALWGDIIATCFGASRNRLLGNMLWEWMSIEDVLAKLAEEKKIAEGYETLKWVYQITEWKHEYPLINGFGEKYLK